MKTENENTHPFSEEIRRAQHDDMVIEMIIERLKQFDTGQHNYSFLDEMKMLEDIYRGDADHMRSHFDDILPKFPVILADEKKNTEYMAVMAVSYGARTAIGVGVPYEKGMLYDGYFLRKISECPTSEKIRGVIKEAYITYARLVHEEQAKMVPSSCVERCKRYISGHITEAISLDILAEIAGVTPTHLSRQFSRTMNMTISQYIKHVKIEMAKDILTLTDRKINEVSDFLNYGSPAYFARVFQKETGVTPHQYRKQNQKIIL